MQNVQLLSAGCRFGETAPKSGQMREAKGTDRGRKYATEDDNLSLERIFENLVKTLFKPC